MANNSVHDDEMKHCYENLIVVDVGANLTNKKYTRDLDSVIQRAKDSGKRRCSYSNRTGRREGEGGPILSQQTVSMLLHIRGNHVREIVPSRNQAPGVAVRFPASLSRHHHITIGK